MHKTLLSSQLPQLCGGRSERKAETFIVLCYCARLALLQRGKWNWNLDSQLLLNALRWALSNSICQDMVMTTYDKGQQHWQWQVSPRLPPGLILWKAMNPGWPVVLLCVTSFLPASHPLVCNSARVAAPVDKFGNWWTSFDWCAQVSTSRCRIQLGSQPFAFSLDDVPLTKESNYPWCSNFQSDTIKYHSGSKAVYDTCKHLKTIYDSASLHRKAET